MRYLPIHVDTENTRIGVFGGGPAAEAKLRTIIKTNAHITVFAKKISAEIKNWVDQNRIDWVKAGFSSDMLSGFELIYAATEDYSLNTAISRAARNSGIFVNVADQKEDCSFITPAIVNRDPVIVSIATAGTSPGMARTIKSDLEERLPPELGKMALAVKSLREKVKLKLEKTSDRQRFWGQIFSQSRSKNFGSLTIGKMENLVRSKLEESQLNTGYVSLVGAGPGNLDLLTIGAKRALHNADVIIYDRLVSQDVLDLARREAEYIYVGKTPGKKSIDQADINAILIEKARAGFDVVRLKSGDPLIFGRADEEIDALIASDIPYKIEPGITSAAAAAAEIGVSLTARGQNKSVSFLTGHDAKGFAEQDWTSLSAPGARAAIYMGVGAARFIQGRLLLHEARSSLPVTVVENASRENQLVLSTTLGALPQEMAANSVTGPAVLLVGYESRKHPQILSHQKVAGL